MDPNLYHLDWERLVEVLTALIIISILVERALSIVFEHRLYVKYFDQKGFKEVITFIVGLIVCIVWNFDAVSMILVSDQTKVAGEIITAAIIAGGSKGSVKLFKDILDIKSSASRDAENLKKTKAAIPAN
jgi:hypothetical protein